jgi:two-component system NtrC family sensor kinase
MKQTKGHDMRQKRASTREPSSTQSASEAATQPMDIFADLEATLNEVAESNPRIQDEPTDPGKNTSDLRALLQVSLVVNSSLVLDDILQKVMSKAVELMEAERGFVMLLDETNELQVKCAYNLCKEEMMEEDFKVSNSIAYQVTRTGKSVYTSDALSDERYANQQSVVELHLRSIMCVPLIVKDRPIGVIYLDNSNKARMFLRSDLYVFELYAQLVSNAMHNAEIYDSLLNHKRYNEEVVSNSPVGLAVVDNSGRVVTINAGALRIFDLNKKDVWLAGRTETPTKFVDILPTGEQPRWQYMMNEVLATGSEFSDPRYFHNTGYEEKALSIKISPISGLPDGGDGLVMAIEDITEKVVMEKYVILSEKLVAKGEMAASVAHELNNYLAITSNNAELLSINLDKQRFDKAKFNSRAIVENVFKIKRFVDSLMDFSRTETEFINYDIKHVIEDLLFSVRVQPRYKRVHFTIDLNQEVPSMEMDVGQLQQVLLNLLNNAADATEEKAVAEHEKGREFKREISITASYDDNADQVKIEIGDNGVGMTDEIKKKLFTLHFTTKKGGHGLGLVNCLKIIERHGGAMTPESELGTGTVFRIVLPRLQPKKLQQDSE